MKTHHPQSEPDRSGKGDTPARGAVDSFDELSRRCRLLNRARILSFPQKLVFPDSGKTLETVLRMPRRPTDPVPAGSADLSTIEIPVRLERTTANGYRICFIDASAAQHLAGWEPLALAGTTYAFDDAPEIEASLLPVLGSGAAESPRSVSKPRAAAQGASPVVPHKEGDRPEARGLQIAARGAGAPAGPHGRGAPLTFRAEDERLQVMLRASPSPTDANGQVEIGVNFPHGMPQFDAVVDFRCEAGGSVRWQYAQVVRFRKNATPASFGTHYCYGQAPRPRPGDTAAHCRISPLDGSMIHLLDDVPGSPPENFLSDFRLACGTIRRAIAADAGGWNFDIKFDAAAAATDPETDWFVLAAPPARRGEGG